MARQSHTVCTVNVMCQEHCEDTSVKVKYHCDLPDMV